MRLSALSSSAPFIKLCWLTDRYVSAQSASSTSTRLRAASCRCIRSGGAAAAPKEPSCRATQRRPRHSRSPSAWTVARWTCWCRSFTRARQTPFCPSSPVQNALITSRRRAAGQRRPPSCSSRPPLTRRDIRGSFFGTWPASTPARPP